MNKRKWEETSSDTEKLKGEKDFKKYEVRSPVMSLLVL